ncbi:hypothetical protein FCV66_15295 [Enterovibrio norvegicus]|uniref:hypothetical protein n=1 Tax=Enterovibrio norvegicus TaxID=188144 RepID=UPI0010BEF76D|nr:hypothetical protein [Enterovibrio norvegicus]TKF12843.1 hypothetical protein FCV66_15295 [Enterovibrio norvegicus]
MASDRLDLLLQKCKFLSGKKRDTEARVWLEIALDEFPTSRELQRFAGKTYLQWGMTQKAIHFLEFEHTEDTFEAPTEVYDHDKVTQDDLTIIEGQLGCAETPWFISSHQEVKVPTPVRKTLTLNKSVGGSRPVKIETDSICSSRSGQKQIVVKRLKTRKTSNASEAAVENESLPQIDTEPSIADIVAEDRITEPPLQTHTPLESSFVPVIENGFKSAVIDELQDESEHPAPFLHETIETEATLSVLSVPPVPSLSKQIEEFKPQTEPEQSVETNSVHFAHAFMNEEENASYDSEQVWDSDQFDQFHDPQYSQPDNGELEWTEESAGLAFYQDDDCLLAFSEEDCELFDVSDDAFLSAFDDFDFDGDLDEEQPAIDEANDAGRLKLTHWERAQQVAVEVIYSTNWSGKHLAFLTDVFFENGWSAARVTMEKEIRSGTTIDELMLARDFKEIWKNCDRYWITLSKLGPYAQVTEATHRHMSWAQALKIIRCFNWLPSIEELEVFLEDEFEYWYQHALMRRVFPVFMKYLCYYRAKNTPYMDFELGAYGPEQSDDPMDNGDLINCNSEYRQRLSHAGLDSITLTTP